MKLQNMKGKQGGQRLSGMPGAMQNGKTEYKSVTVAEDSTAEEFMDFYLDDDTRTTWVITSAMLYCRIAVFMSLPAFMVKASQ